MFSCAAGKQFLSYFGGKLDLVDFGGRETALLPVENAVDLFHTRLFHLKGTGSERAVAIHEVGTVLCRRC